MAARPALPENRVSRNAKISDPSKAREVRIAILTESDKHIECSCRGFVKVHPRSKVRGDSAQRHIDKKHGGQALWM